MHTVDSAYIDAKIREAIQEDLKNGDVTTEALFPEPFPVSAVIIARQPGVLAGGELVQKVFTSLDDAITVTLTNNDGSEFQKGDHIAALEGDGRTILNGERIALNFLGWLSGIATMTREFVKRAAETGIKILDTRKTHPGMRLLEKYAVRMGGGENHRIGLYDRYLIKDNHRCSIDSIGNAIDLCKKHRETHNPETIIEVEVENLNDVRNALEHNADIILLDNMSPEKMKQAVQLIDGKAKVEASGGITLDNVTDVARSGIDYISIGALTHSAPNIDFSMEFNKS